MDKQFSLIIGSLGNNQYSINFRCWLLNENGNQETLAFMVESAITFEQALTLQENFIIENK
jgi:hypothetical protein